MKFKSSWLFQPKCEVPHFWMLLPDVLALKPDHYYCFNFLLRNFQIYRSWENSLINPIYTSLSFNNDQQMVNLDFSIYPPSIPNPTGYFEANFRHHFTYWNWSIPACESFRSYVNINYNTDSHLLSVYSPTSQVLCTCYR